MPLFSRERLSDWFRARRAQRLRDVISVVSNGRSKTKLIDIGGEFIYWKKFGLDFLREHRVSITLANNISSERISGEVFGVQFEYIDSDARDLCEIRNNQFDLAHSNSVIEHVGLWPDMKLFAQELHRVAPAHYVQTPYFWFPIDPHYHTLPLFHWFPRPMRSRLLHVLPLEVGGRIRDLDQAFSAIECIRMLDCWQFKYLFPNSQVTYERFAGVVKSLIAIKVP